MKAPSTSRISEVCLCTTPSMPDRGPKPALLRLLAKEFPGQGPDKHACFLGTTQHFKQHRTEFKTACNKEGNWRDVAIAVHEWAGRTPYAEFPHPDSEKWEPYEQRLKGIEEELEKKAKEAQHKKTEEARQRGYTQGRMDRQGDCDDEELSESSDDAPGPSNAGAAPAAAPAGAEWLKQYIEQSSQSNSMSVDEIVHPPPAPLPPPAAPPAAAAAPAPAEVPGSTSPSSTDGSPDAVIAEPKGTRRADGLRANTA